MAATRHVKNWRRFGFWPSFCGCGARSPSTRHGGSGSRSVTGRRTRSRGSFAAIGAHCTRRSETVRRRYLGRVRVRGAARRPARGGDRPAGCAAGVRDRAARDARALRARRRAGGRPVRARRRSRGAADRTARAASTRRCCRSWSTSRSARGARLAYGDDRDNPYLIALALACFYLIEGARSDALGLRRLAGQVPTVSVDRPRGGREGHPGAPRLDGAARDRTGGERRRRRGARRRRAHVGLTARSASATRRSAGGRSTGRAAAPAGRRGGTSRRRRSPTGRAAARRRRSAAKNPTISECGNGHGCDPA